MRSLLIVFLAFAVLPVFAYAEDNKIVVTGDKAAPKSVLRTPSHRTAPPPAAKPVEKAAPEKQVASPVQKPVALEQADPDKAKAKQTPTSKKPAKKPAAPKKKKEASPAKKKVAKKQAAPASSIATPTAAPARAQRLGPQMTADDAIRIAIDVGPPARSVNAYPVNYHGIHAYQVVFTTEEGDRSVFIDRETGRPVK